MQDRGLPSCRLLQSHVGAAGATVRPTSQTGTQAEGGLAACTDYSAGKGQPWRHIAHLCLPLPSALGVLGAWESVQRTTYSTLFCRYLSKAPKNQEKPGHMVLETLFQFFIYLCSLHCPDQASCLPHRITEICWQHVSQLLPTDVCSGKHLCTPREAAAVVTTPRGLNPGL